MAKGDATLVLSMFFMVVGFTLFLTALGSREWIEDTVQNSTVCYGLWLVCHNESSVCSAINPGSPKATRVLECLALAVYGLALVSCFTADDRAPQGSCRVWTRRYIHVVASLTAGGLSCLAVLVFAVSYEDDDWFSQPVLGYSYWLALAGCICTLCVGVFRILFIVWPGRPPLPMRKQSARKDAKRPKEEGSQIQTHNESGPLPPLTRRGNQLPPLTPEQRIVRQEISKMWAHNEADPIPAIPSETLNHVAMFHPEKAQSVVRGSKGTVKRPPNIQALFSRWYHKKSRTTVATISAAAAVESNRGHDRNMAPNISQSQSSEEQLGLRTERSERKASEPLSDTTRTPSLKSVSRLKEKSAKHHKSSEERLRPGLENSIEAPRHSRGKKRVSVVVFPADGDDVPDGVQKQRSVAGFEQQFCATQYELALNHDDIKTRAVSPPPSIALPLVHVYQGMSNELTVKTSLNKWKGKLRH